MCDIDGLTCPRDCFDVGCTYGRDGTSLAAMFGSLAANDVTELADWQMSNLEDGWHAGRADWEACEAAKVVPMADVPVVIGDDEIPF